MGDKAAGRVRSPPADLQVDAVVSVDVTAAMPWAKRPALRLPVPAVRASRAQLTGRARGTVPWTELLAAGPLPAGHPRPTAHDLALLQYTSGTTGLPEGEVWVRGPQVFQGCWERPEETARTLTTDRWLRTGDIVTVDDAGFLRVVDRLKEVVITGGFDVAPTGVENALRQHDDVEDAAVVGLTDPGGGEVVVAAVVLAPGAEPDEPALREHCCAELTRYKVPRRADRIRPSSPRSSRASRAIGCSTRTAGPRSSTASSSTSRAGARSTPNSRACRMLRGVSFSPTETNRTIVGVVEATVQNERGARLSIPAAERELTPAIGRGTTRASTARAKEPRRSAGTPVRMVPSNHLQGSRSRSRWRCTPGAVHTAMERARVLGAPIPAYGLDQ